MRERYRLEIFGRPAGPWRSDRRAALADAVKSGEAEYDTERRQHFLMVGAEVAFEQLADE
jgi:hypothetical protein